MVTIVVFSGDLDKTLASFVIATGAAASGMKVNMFFTFWGLKLIQREKARPKELDWMRRMFSFMVKAGPEKRPLSKMNMFGIGPMMMKKLMKKSNVPSLKEMLATAKSLGVKLTACSMTMGVMGVTKETLIPEVNNVAGVASFLADAKDSQITLFI
ncbi:DsrE/DsrF/DrsH-like family protein [candidate division KSB1 bacterium]|nr:DsrE/DsrF/DrsH-like family protein [candidate division KSB1 bacterium]